MNKFFRSLIFLPILIVFGACDPGNTTTGNPFVEIRMSNFSTSSLKSGFVRGFAVSELKMCFKRLRFKTEGESTDSNPADDEDNIDLELGQITLNSSGTTLTSVQVPAGTYTRIEFDLEKNCDDTTKPSVRIANDQTGSPFETDDRVTIKFEGTVQISDSQVLELAIGKIITAADSVTAAANIKSELEAADAQGSF